MFSMQTSMQSRPTVIGCISLPTLYLRSKKSMLLSGGVCFGTWSWNPGEPSNWTYASPPVCLLKLIMFVRNLSFFCVGGGGGDRQNDHSGIIPWKWENSVLPFYLDLQLPGAKSGLFIS